MDPWFGLEAIKSDTTYSQVGGDKTVSHFAMPLGFGIERNIVWDWLVLRVGFRKTIYGSSESSNGTTSLFTNPEADGTVNDQVGGGIGINIEEKLKIDAVLAEDMLYKWANIISGNSHLS